MSTFLDVLPLLVAGSALILGVLIGKSSVACRFTSGKARMVWIVFVLLAVVFGSQATSWTITQLTLLGVELVFAKYITIAVLSLLSGIGFSCLNGKTTKT